MESEKYLDMANGHKYEVSLLGPIYKCFFFLAGHNTNLIWYSKNIPSRGKKKVYLNSKMIGKNLCRSLSFNLNVFVMKGQIQCGFRCH